MFSLYKSVQNRGVMHVGNDDPCEIVGIRSIQFKMHDGMVRTLENVRHIPKMTRNLISISTLDEGFKYSAGGGVLKVSRGSLIHMAGDLNPIKLYILRGSVLHNSDVHSTVSDTDMTDLWHKRL